MLWKKHNSNSKWFHSDQHIDRWLRDRQTLLGLLYRMLSIIPFEDEVAADDEKLEILNEFCSMLIDYVSAGHFEIFEELANAQEQNTHAGLDRDMMVEILKTTHIATQFSNKYSDTNRPATKLTADLEILSENLAKRMDLEDSLIQEYLKATNQPQVQENLKTG